MSATGAPRLARRVLVAVGVLSLTLSACTEPSPAPPTTADFERQARVLQGLTAVDGTQARPPSAVEQGAVSLRVTWEVEGQTDLTWERYRAEVSRRLTSESELRPSETSDGSLLFVRTLPGDTHTLRIERLPEGTPTRLLVTFTAAAD